MKLIITGLCLLIAISISAQSKDEALIRNVLDQQTRAWNKADITGFMNGYWQSDSLMFIGKNGITYGWSNTLANYKRNYSGAAGMGKLSFEILVVKQLSAEYFHVVGKWNLQLADGNQDGQFTLLFKKINGTWVIIADHSS